MSKSIVKAMEENSMLRREIRSLKDRNAELEARIASLLQEREVSADGSLHR